MRTSRYSCITIFNFLAMPETEVQQPVLNHVNLPTDNCAADRRTRYISLKLKSRLIVVSITLRRITPNKREETKIRESQL